MPTFSREAAPAINFLHLSDLHCGLEQGEWLWPDVQRAFYQDLRDLVHQAGPWDVVFFTGDLTQAGTSEQFSRLNGLLEPLWWD